MEQDSHQLGEYAQSRWMDVFADRGNPHHRNHCYFQQLRKEVVLFSHNAAEIYGKVLILAASKQ